jgi:hypothetical protein
MASIVRFALSLIATVTLSQTAFADSQTFGAWKVDIQVDEFEGKVEPTLIADILGTDGSKIGTMSIGYFVVQGGKFDSAIVSPSIKGLDPTFPACDYEYMKYKLDESESAYFPTRGYACPALDFRVDMAQRMSSAKTFRFSASERVGVVSLDGFREAWAYTLKAISKK